jgi:hypothetical protein
MSSQRIIREVLEAIAAEVEPFGLTVVLVGKGKHYKAELKFKGRVLACMAISGSPQDGCDCVNQNRRLARRILRSHGYAC